MSSGKKIFSTTGNPMLSAKKAARILGCAPDYVSRLCREGKLDGVRHQGQWHVERESLRRFELGREAARAARAEDLAQLRRNESVAYAYANKTPLERFIGQCVAYVPKLELGKPAAVMLAASLMLGGAALVSSAIMAPQGGALPAAAARVESPFFSSSLFTFDDLLKRVAALFAPKSVAIEPNEYAQTQPRGTLPVVPATTIPTSTQPTATHITNTYPVIERVTERVVEGNQISLNFVTHDFLSTQLERVFDAISDSDGDSVDFSDLVVADVPDLSSLYLPLGGGALTGGLTLVSATTSATSSLAGLALAGLDCSIYNNGGVLTTDASGNVICDNDNSTAGSGAPGGNNTYVQYNNGGDFGGDAGFTYDASADRVTVAYASTTGITASYASTTDFVAGSATVSGLTLGSLSGLLKASGGAVTTAIAGVDYQAAGNYATFSYPFPSNATSTAITFSGGIVGNLTGDISGNAGTVTNGVYTTTFNSLFDPRFITQLAATSSVASITTLPNLSLPYSQLTGTPSLFDYPFPSNATSTLVAFNGGLASASTTLTGPFVFGNATGTNATTTNLYVSSTLAASAASTTNLVVSGITNGGTQCLQINSSGTVSGTGSACGAGGNSFEYPFPSNATSTQLAFNGGATFAGATTTALAVTGSTTVSSVLNVGGVINANGGITGALTGNASTASALQTARTINGIAFDGTANITINAASSTLLANDNTWSGANAFSQTITGSISGNAGTVTNGVYTTTFNSLFDPRFITQLAATSSVASITTLPNLSLPYSQLTGTPSLFDYPFPSNATSTLIAFNGGLTAYASSTVGNGAQAGGLTISGNATTTGVLKVQGAGTSTFAGDILITGNIVPSVNNAYYLGSADKVWHSVFIGPGSLYVNGQQVISTNGSNDVVISTDPNENLVVQTSGTANIELNPTGGQVQVKNTLAMSAGKSITTTDLSALPIPTGVAAGNITVSGNTIAASNLNGGISITPSGSGGTYVTSGNVGIGNTNPTNKLNVQGDVAAQYFTATSTTAASTFPYASSTALTVSGSLWGAGLSTCNASVDKVLWNNGQFSCGTDQSGGGGGTDVNWTFFNGSGIRPATTSNQVVIGGSATTTLLSPLAKLGVFGGASIDYASTTGITASYASTTDFVAGSATVSGLTLGLLSGLIAGNSGATYAAATSSLAVSGPLSYSGTLGALVGGTGGTLSISQANSSTNGYLSSTDWSTFNNKISSSSLSSANGLLTYNSSTGVFTASTSPTFSAATTSALGITSLAHTLLSTNAQGSVVATTSVGANYITGTLGAINGTTFNRGDAITITAASSTLLADNNTFSGANTFSGGLTLGSLSGLIAGNSGVTYAAATGTVSASNGLTVTAGQAVIGSGLTITGTNAAADGATKGVAAFTAADFDAASGVISLDYTGGQAANSSTKGFLTSADWSTFNNKISSSSLSSANDLLTYNSSTGVFTASTSPTFTAATTSALGITGITSSLLKTTSTGGVVAAIAGTDYLTNADIFAYPFPSNATSTLIAFNGGLASASTTLTGPFVFANATGTSATTTNLAITGAAASLLKTNGSGSVIAAVSGTDYEAPLTFSTGLLRDGNTVTNTIGYPFPSNATSTLIAFNGGLTAATTTLGTTTLTHATSTTLFAGRLTGSTAAFGGTASTTIDASGNLVVGGTMSGAGLATCSGSADKLLWNAGAFSCGTDAGAGGTGDANWTFFNNSGVRLATTSNQVIIGTNATSTFSKLQVVGGAFFDYASSTVAAFGGTATTTIDSAGNVGIGTSSPSAKLAISGGNILHAASGSPALSNTITGGSVTSKAVAIAGRYAYSADYAAGLRIIDITNPNTPVLAGSYTGSASVVAVAVAGRYAYIGDETSAGFKILDVSNPSSPTPVGSLAVNGFITSISVSGKYAYIADYNNGLLRIVDISDPENPVQTGSYSTGGWVAAVAVAGKYAYLGDQFNGEIRILDISNPVSPSLVKTYTTNVGGPSAFYLSGQYLYVSDISKGFYSLNISNPANPVAVGSYNPSGAYYGVSVAGDYAYVGDHAGNITVLNVSVPSAPSLVGSLSLGGQPWGLAVAGKYAYVANDTDGLEIVGINGAQLPAANIGSIASNAINVSEDLAVGNNIYAGGGLDVGISGIFSRGTIAAYVASSTQTNPAVATFMGGNVGIGTTSPYAKLSVAGQAVAAYFTATTTTASTFPYASSTALTVSGTGYFGTATTTSLVVSGNTTLQNIAANSLLYTNGSQQAAAVSVSAPLSFAAGTLSISQANSSTNGYLSSTDWSTFNNKISSSSLSASTPLSYNSSTGAFTIQAANSGQHGYLSSTDWSTFNNKISSSSLSSANDLLTYNSSTGVFTASTSPTFTAATTTSFAITGTGTSTIASNLVFDNGKDIWWKGSGGNPTSILEVSGDTTFLRGAGGTPTLRFDASTGANIMTLLESGNVGIGTTSPQGFLSMSRTFSTPASATRAGIDQFLTYSMTGGGTHLGNSLYIYNNPQTDADTLVGSMIKIEDSTSLANTVRGLEVQAHRGTNTQGENTAISAFGRTFGVRAVTEGDAGAVYEPAALFAQTRGTTQGNAIRAYSSSVTSADALVSILHDTSTFSGAGLLMNLADGSGSFTGNLLDLRVNDAAKLVVTSSGYVGVGTSSPQTPLDIYTNSNASGLRLRGKEIVAGYSEIADMYVGAGGQFIISTASSTDLTPYIAVDANDDEHGFQIKDSGSGNTAYANFYMNDAATDYLNINVWAGNSTPGLVLQQGGNVGLGTTSPWGLLSVNPNGITGPAFAVGSSTATNFVITNAGKVGIGTAAPSAKLTISNNIATGFLDNYSEYQQILYDGGNAGASYGFGVKSNYTVFNSASGGYSFDKAGNATLVVIDTNGRVGIGTTTPGGKLELYGDDGYGGAIRVTGGDGNTATPIYIQSDKDYDWVANNIMGNAGGGISIQSKWNTGATNLLLQQDSGKVGIGTTSPISALSVVGEIISGGSGGGFSAYGRDGAGILGIYRTGSVSRFWDSAAGDVITFNTSGVAGIGTASQNQGKLEVKGGSVCVDTNSDDNATSCIANESDARLKKNIEALSASSSLETILALNPVSFDWRVDDPDVLKHYPLIARYASSTRSIGLIAQEVMPILPEALSLETVGDVEVQYYQLDYIKVIPHLIGAVKEIANLGASIQQKLVAWFADAGNGIAKLFAEEIHAESLYGKKLCLRDDSGETCVTKVQLDALLSGAAASSGGGGAPAPDPAPEPATEPTPDPAPASEPESASAPEPGSSSESPSSEVSGEQGAHEQAPEQTPPAHGGVDGSEDGGGPASESAPEPTPPEPASTS